MVEVNTLRNDLRYLTAQEFYLKHIVKSHNWYFSDYLGIPQEEIVDKMDYFKEIVSSGLNINFHSLQIVGSAKTGYSLSPYKLLCPFHGQAPDAPSSDVDIAIISEQLYQSYWSDLREVHGLWNRKKTYERLTASIFRGYINDKDILGVKELKKKWEGLVTPVNVSLQDKLGIEHPITYRLYRSWDDLESYQMIGIYKAQKKLEEDEQNV